MAQTRISMTLMSEDGKICCAECRSPIAARNEPWKEQASLTELAVARLPGAGLNVEKQVVLRRFSCRGCGALLDTEIALAGDPFLQDFVEV